MAVPDQLTGQKLEENPLLPTDNQKDLTYTLTRIFRLLAQIVNPLVAWAGQVDAWWKSWKWVTVENFPPPAAYTHMVVSAPDPTGTANLALNKKGNPVSNNFIGMREGKNRWLMTMGGAESETGGNAGSDFALYRYSDAGANTGMPMSISRQNGNAFFMGGGIDLSSASGGTAIYKATGATAQLVLNKNASGQQALIWGTVGAVNRWCMQLGNETAETGGNLGSDFFIQRFADAGGYNGLPFSISRESGAVSMPQQPCFAGELGGELSGVKNFVGNAPAQGNLSVNSPYLQVWDTGLWFVHVQQLMAGPANLYLTINRNGVTVKHAYASGANLSEGPLDVSIAAMIPMNRGDYFTFSITAGPAGSVWTGAHSSLAVWKIA